MLSSFTHLLLRGAIVLAGGGGRQFRGAEVIVHVYDLSPVNDYSYDFGVGAFHSGVEVMGTEYTYGGHEVCTQTCIHTHAHFVDREVLVEYTPLHFFHTISTLFCC